MVQFFTQFLNYVLGSTSNQGVSTVDQYLYMTAFIAGLFCVVYLFRLLLTIVEGLFTVFRRK